MEKDGFVYTQKEGVNITSKDGSRAATISGGSTLAWEPVIKEDETDESQPSIAAGETGSEQRLENTAVVSGVNRTTISNALVELYDATTLKLQNVALAADTSLALHASAASATVDASNVGLHMKEGANATTGASTTTVSALTLNLTGSDKSYTFGSGLRMLDISTDMLQGNLTITGESLMVNFDGYDFSEYDAVQLSFATGVTVDTQMLITGQAQVEQGDTPQLLTGTYVIGENVGSIIFIMNYHIPEPSTSALGLLALAGLAARRRRKA
jgi:MYXO-CTERM domain-containing protein